HRGQRVGADADAGAGLRTRVRYGQRLDGLEQPARVARPLVVRPEHRELLAADARGQLARAREGVVERARDADQALVARAVAVVVVELLEVVDVQQQQRERRARALLGAP